MVSQRNVSLKTETDGRMFPESNSSETIINCLLHEANKNNIAILMNHEVMKLEKITSAPGDHRFEISFKDGSLLTCDFVCVACGGFPKSEQYQWLALLGHTVEKPVPSLFTFNVPQNPISELMGISLENVFVKINQTKLSQTGPILITHWGFQRTGYFKTFCICGQRAC